MGSPNKHPTSRPLGALGQAMGYCGVTQVLVAQKVTMGVYKGVSTTELDELAAETAASLTATHPDYALVRPCHCSMLCSHGLVDCPFLALKRVALAGEQAGVTGAAARSGGRN